jgi:hypothetical protein
MNAIAKNDAALADSAHAAERAQIIANIETAEDLRSNALISALRMTVTLGATSKEEVAASWPSCNNPGVYASWFNVGHKAQQVVGQKAALDLIAKAAAVKGQAFQNARDALQAVIKEAKAQGVKELKPAAAKMAAKAAIAKVSTPKIAPAKKSEAKGPSMQDAATMAAAAIACGKGHRELAAFVLLASQNAHRLPAPEGREEAHRAALKALELAADAWSVFKK